MVEHCMPQGLKPTCMVLHIVLHVVSVLLDIGLHVVSVLLHVVLHVSSMLLSIFLHVVTVLWPIQGLSNCHPFKPSKAQQPSTGHLLSLQPKSMKSSTLCRVIEDPLPSTCKGCRYSPSPSKPPPTTAAAKAARPPSKQPQRLLVPSPPLDNPATAKTADPPSLPPSNCKGCRPPLPGNCPYPLQSLLPHRCLQLMVF